MASYVQNILMIDEDHIQAVCQFIRQKERIFDFNAIYPLPSVDMTPEEKIKCWGTKGNAINAVFHPERCAGSCYRRAGRKVSRLHVYLLLG